MMSRKKKKALSVTISIVVLSVSLFTLTSLLSGHNHHGEVRRTEAMFRQIKYEFVDSRMLLKKYRRESFLTELDEILFPKLGGSVIATMWKNRNDGWGNQLKFAYSLQDDFVTNVTILSGGSDQTIGTGNDDLILDLEFRWQNMQTDHN